MSASRPRRHWLAALATWCVLFTAPGAAVAGPPVHPPPAKEHKNGKWQVRVNARGADSEPYWFAAAMSLVFGAGLGPTVVGRYTPRPLRAAGIGLVMGAVVGTGVVLVLGSPDGAPEALGPVIAAGYAVVGAVAGGRSARERHEKTGAPAVPPNTT